MTFQLRTKYPCSGEPITLPVSTIPGKEATLVRRCPCCGIKWHIGVTRVADTVLGGTPHITHKAEWVK